MDGKRKFVRFKAPLHCKYSRLESNVERSVMADDISMGGMKIVAEQSAGLPTDSILNIYLLLPNRTLKVLGKTVWVKDYQDRVEAGIRFIQIYDSYKQEIYDYIFKYHPDQITQRWWHDS